MSTSVGVSIPDAVYRTRGARPASSPLTTCAADVDDITAESVATTQNTNSTNCLRIYSVPCRLMSGVCDESHGAAVPLSASIHGERQHAQHLFRRLDRDRRGDGSLGQIASYDLDVEVVPAPDDLSDLAQRRAHQLERAFAPAGIELRVGRGRSRDCPVLLQNADVTAAQSRAPSRRRCHRT